MEFLDWFFIIFIGFLIALVFAAVFLAAPTNRPCSEFKNWQIEDVPARCLSEYTQPQGVK